MQLKREANLLTVIGLRTMHAVCRITFMLYPIFLYRRMILRNWVLKSLQAYIFLNLYTKIRVSIGFAAEEILVRHSTVDGFVSCKSYDKRDDFDFEIVNFLSWMVRHPMVFIFHN